MGGGHACAGGCKQKGREGVGLKRTRAGRGRLGAHSQSRLVMALHCGGRVPVSWLSRRYLRTGGGHACVRAVIVGILKLSISNIS